MIKQVYSLEGECSTHPLFTKIKSLYVAYGSKYPFCRFYRGDNVIISKYRDSGMVYFNTESKKEIDFSQVVEFIALSRFSFVQCNIPLDIDDEFSYETGGLYEYQSRDVIITTEVLVNHSISECYNIIKDAFYSDFTQEEYERWYVDMSHKIRHGVSQVYNIEQKSSVTLQSRDETYVVLSQIATQGQYQEQGLAKTLIELIASQNLDKRVVLYSKNKQSDAFYEKVGFGYKEQWHNYSNK